jgi:hypothetical protein
MIPAPVIPRATTPFVALILVLVAGLGGYIGYSRVAPPPGGGDASAQVSTATVAAKAATPIPDSPAAAVPDEAYIRRIAREEAEAALHPKHATPAPDANDDASDDAQYQPAAAGSQSSPGAPSGAAQPAASQNVTQPPMG